MNSCAYSNCSARPSSSSRMISTRRSGSPTAIAIMKDGEIVQIGKPEELVINPATDYVAEFTRGVTRAKVMTAATVMSPAASDASFGGDVAPGARIAEIANRIVHGDRPYAVRDSDGRLLGQLDREAVINVLADEG